MIVEKNDNKTKGQFSPRILEQSHKGMPNWQDLPTLKWLESLMTLNESVIAGKDRLYWMLTFRDWVKVNVKHSSSKEIPDTEQSSCLVLINQLAYRLCDWPLMIDVFQVLNDERQLLSHNDYDEQLMVEVLHCAVAHWQLGQLNEATKLLSRYMPHFADSSPLHQFYQQVKRDSDANHFLMTSPENEKLYICPLEEQHLSSFTWVYQDTDIAALCNLPDFSSDEQWYQWLDRDQVNSNKHVFAVNHASWGFIGVVSIEVHDGVGFFYYWLGQDFQGGGLGPLAVSLLLDIAKEHMQLESCYAKAFKHNVASQKAMAKMGFMPVPFAIDKPNDDQMYFYRGQQKERQQWWQELVTLAAITDIDSKILR